MEASALERLRAAHQAGPTVVQGRPEYVFQYTPGVSRPPPKASYMTSFELGTQVSFGRGRWSSDGTSIFSVADGKRMAATPARPLNNYEAVRQAKIARAQLESPQMAGLRLLPKFTPGRAFFWGSVLAVWGTAALALTAARQLGIDSLEQAGPVLRRHIAPLAAGLEASFSPLRSSMALDAGREVGADVQASEVSQRLRTMLGARRHTPSA